MKRENQSYNNSGDAKNEAINFYLSQRLIK